MNLQCGCAGTWYFYLWLLVQSNITVKWLVPIVRGVGVGSPERRGIGPGRKGEGGSVSLQPDE